MFKERLVTALCGTALPFVRSRATFYNVARPWRTTLSHEISS
jgi:hypothetical protein